MFTCAQGWPQRLAASGSNCAHFKFVRLQAWRQRLHGKASCARSRSFLPV